MRQHAARETRMKHLLRANLNEIISHKGRSRTCNSDLVPNVKKTSFEHLEMILYYFFVMKF